MNIEQLWNALNQKAINLYNSNALRRRMISSNYGDYAIEYLTSSTAKTYFRKNLIDYPDHRIQIQYWMYFIQKYPNKESLKFIPKKYIETNELQLFIKLL